MDGEGRIDNLQTMVELPAVANDHDIIGVRAIRERVTEFGTDAGRFAGGNNEWFRQAPIGMRT